jgi:uncharacterized protein (DUF1778 family)
MKKKSKTKKILKSESVEILVDKEMKEAIIRAAKAERKSVGQYCRDVLLERLYQHRFLVRPGEK